MDVANPNRMETASKVSSAFTRPAIAFSYVTGMAFPFFMAFPINGTLYAISFVPPYAFLLIFVLHTLNVKKSPAVRLVGIVLVSLAVLTFAVLTGIGFAFDLLAPVMAGWSSYVSPDSIVLAG